MKIHLAGCLAICFIMLHFGLGLHADIVKASDISILNKLIFAFEAVYLGVGILTKHSVLLLYMRLFPLDSMKRTCMIIGGLTLTWTVVIGVLVFLQCRPLAKVWTLDLPGHCINIKIAWMVYAIPNTVADAIILVLPIKRVWMMRISLGRRIQVSLIFVLGTFVVFTSIYRFTTLLRYQTYDISWTMAPVITWCLIESSSGIISACLPTLAPLIAVIKVRVTWIPWPRPQQAPVSLPVAEQSHNTIGAKGKKKKPQNIDDSLLYSKRSTATGDSTMVTNSSRVDEILEV
ncbi:hypothetical protein BP6252_11250 [Coleophoma cylindrospora]|uniref:Rhodopsin domain-containing protein n=1 Tax=Coleophoma cylindrospora TaxID=1849047 RepID=A0A3D8QPH6_9HELO|nr:hypothetical protein BP6252_11250 [Coleophoma cylindrospora]